MKKLKKHDPRIIKFKSRPLSWSSISQFGYNKEIWYDRYIRGNKSRPTGPILFGKEIDEKFQTDKGFYPEITRLKDFQHELRCKIGKIEMVGFLDNFDLENKSFAELKTGKKWDQERADTHGQLTLYAAMIYLIYGIKPNDLKISLIWMPTEEKQDFTTGFVKDMKPVIFPVKKNMRDILIMMASIENTYKEMLDFIANHEE